MTNHKFLRKRIGGHFADLFGKEGIMRYFPHTPSTIEHMLKAIGCSSIEELFSSIPKEARLTRPLHLPKEVDERRLKKEFLPFSMPLKEKIFLGAGICSHFVPEWISQQLLRAEWYTSYTPYQPEASQGTLQAIFEFQSMVASLFGLDTANASMYDGATALAEALLMAVRVTHKKTVILSSAIHPEYRETARTYLEFARCKLIEVDCNRRGITDIDMLLALVKEHGADLAAIAYQSPNFFGCLEGNDAFAHLAHSNNALLIGVNTDASALAFLRSFGACGVDIAVGEGQSMLGGANLGGPGVGLFACKHALLRQMPGRLVGETTDKKGKRGFVLTLSTREQHIRREKATSNICTNHNLMALSFAMALTAYGKTGLKNLAKINIKKTLYFRKMLKELGVPIAFEGPHYNETVVRFIDEATQKKRVQNAKEAGFLVGLSLSTFYKNLSGHLLVATTELHEDRDIRQLAQLLAGVNQ